MNSIVSINVGFWLLKHSFCAKLLCVNPAILIADGARANLEIMIQTVLRELSGTHSPGYTMKLLRLLRGLPASELETNSSLRAHFNLLLENQVGTVAEALDLCQRSLIVCFGCA
jgi:hypothetical protein